MRYSRSIDIPYKKLVKDDFCEVYRLLVKLNEKKNIVVSASFEVNDKKTKLETAYSTFEEFNEDILHDYDFEVVMINIHGRGPDGINTHIQLHYRSNARWYYISINGSSKSWVDEVFRAVNEYYKNRGKAQSVNTPSNSQISVTTDVVSRKYTIIGLWIAGLTLFATIAIPVALFFYQR
jgi:hypothetical protein